MRDEPDYEFDLREYVDIAIKRKKIVFAVFLTSVLPVVVWSFLSPRIYEVSMIIEPPISAITDTGVQGWDSVTNIKAKIEVGAFNAAIATAMNLSKNPPKFIVNIPKDTRLLKVRLLATADETELSKTALLKLLEILNNSYSKIIEDKRNRIDNQIKIIQSQIGTKENEIKLKNEQFKILESRERQFVEDIKNVRDTSEKLLAKRETVFERGNNKDDVAALFYASSIQQNMSYFTQLQDDLAELKNKKESVMSAVENLKSSINESRIGISDLNLAKGGVQNIQVVQEPGRSFQPVGPNRRKNTLLAGAFGLIAGLVFAYGLEWWERVSLRS